jgi:DNA-binding phage protein
MIALEVSSSQYLHAAKIATQMRAGGLPEDFVASALALARTSRGVYELMALWEEASTEQDRDEVIADIQSVLEEEHGERVSEPVKKPYLKFDQLDDAVARITAAKKKLRDLIDRHGGVTKVAAISGIPQPSLSRMLSDASLPRKTTLYRIANALDVPETEIVTDFTW